ncbi:MAG: response regulator [Bacteroidales bacterium]|nr:response regulator [Bacteroidales bacterium]
MELLSKFLNRLSGRLEQQADLQIINKTIIVHGLSLISFIAFLAYGAILFYKETSLLSLVLLTASLLSFANMLLLSFTRRYRLCGILITGMIGLVSLFILFIGRNNALEMFLVALFPVIIIPIYGLLRGQLATFLYIILVVAVIVIHNYYDRIPSYGLDFTIGLIGVCLIVFLLVYLYEYISGYSRQRLEKSILESRNDSRQKDDFISKLSHQIRTPLNNLTVVSNLINKSKLDSEQRDMFETIIASTNNLINVVNNIVKVSEVKIEKELSAQVSFDLFSTINNTLKLFRDQHKERLNIDLIISKNIRSYFIGDPIRIKQIFLNIIENIIKSETRENLEIIIEVDQIRENEFVSELEFAINCPSLQIDRDEFGNFYGKPDPDSIALGADKLDEFFLDFTIARKIIQYYKGDLDIISEENKTLLRFSIELKKDARSALRKPEAEKESNKLLPGKRKIDLQNASILLVEDNAINQKIIILSLKNAVKNIDIAHHGKEALDKFGTSKYDLILMDIQMPVMNGIIATKKIRELESATNAHTPIIAITANALSGDKETCLAAGMNDYISKPFHVDILVQKMKNLLEVND